MVYLNTHEVGFDAKCLGFPSVQTCQAIVYLTSDGLYGYHDAYNAPEFSARCDIFAQFVQGKDITHQAKALCIIGVVCATERFEKKRSGKKLWKNELVTVAEKLGFQGHIYRGRLEEGVAKENSVYIRFDTDTNSEPPCTIKYDIWGKNTLYYSEDTVLPDDLANHGQIKVKGVDWSTGKEVKEYKLTAADEDPRPVWHKGSNDEGNLRVFTKLKKFR